MELGNRHNKERVQINSLEKALDVLDGIGCASNSAYLINSKLDGGAYSILVYEATLFPNRGVRKYDIPKNRILNSFLFEIFDSYLYKPSFGTPRSQINVDEVTEENVERFKHIRLEKGTFYLTMLLYFKKEHSKEISRVLKSYSDSTRRIGAVEFCLD